MERYKRMTTNITTMKWVYVISIVIIWLILVSMPVYSQLIPEEEENRNIEQELEKMELESQKPLQQGEQTLQQGEQTKQQFSTLESLQKTRGEATELFKPKNEIVKEKLEQSRLIYNQTGSIIKAIKALPTKSEIEEAGLKVCESFGPELGALGCIPTMAGLNNYMLEIFDKGIREAPNELAESVMTAIKERWMTEMSK